MITAINEVTYTPTPITINGALPTIVLALIMFALIATTTYRTMSNHKASTMTTANIPPTATDTTH